MARPPTTLTTLAQQAAAQIGFTARRWWREASAPDVLRVEVERRLVGAPPALAELTVAIPFPTRPRQARPAPTPLSTRTRLKPRTKRPAAGGRRMTRARKA